MKTPPHYPLKRGESHVDGSANQDPGFSGVDLSRSANGGLKKREQHCGRCRNHNFHVKLKNHKLWCPYASCMCEKCQLLLERRNVMARQVALRRRQDSQMQRLRDLQQNTSCSPSPHAHRKVEEGIVDASLSHPLSPQSRPQDTNFAKKHGTDNAAVPSVNPFVQTSYQFRGVMPGHVPYSDARLLDVPTSDISKRNISSTLSNLLKTPLTMTPKFIRQPQPLAPSVGALIPPSLPTHSLTFPATAIRVSPLSYPKPGMPQMPLEPPAPVPPVDPAIRLPSNFVFSYWRNLFALSLPSTWESYHQKEKSQREEHPLVSCKPEEVKGSNSTPEEIVDDPNDDNSRSNVTKGQTFPVPNSDSEEEIHV